MNSLLKDTEIKARASQLSGWTVEGDKLRCTRKFQDFIAAIDFVKVTVNLTTHDAGGLTEKDFALAKEISSLK
ncbi:MAG: 4a-hydroxytetrahydrobiopterin dehydratase [Oscillatoriales cyanobacterium]|nr:MAG: 4a-hydroxytetrahydrobiopterin dehydratase [Oscillatoriales cyanobacterium]